jgi:hypothetical protein
VPLRLTVRLVIAGIATLVTALLLVTLLGGRPTPNPRTSAIAGAEAWAMVEHLFHVDANTPGMLSSGTTSPVPTTPPSIAAGGSSVAQLPPAAALTPAGGRFAAIDRHAQAPKPAPAPAAAPPPAPVVVAPPVVSAPAPNPAPLPAPVPVLPAPSLLGAVTSLLASLLGLLTGG